LNRKQRRAKLRKAAAKTHISAKAELPQNMQPISLPKQRWLLEAIRKVPRGTRTILTAFATAVTLLGLYALRPNVLIEPYVSTDPSRPFAQQFSVQNASAYAIHDVIPLCGLPPDSGFNVSNLSIAMANEQVQTLEVGAKTTLTCSIGTGPMQQELNIIPWVKYTIPFGIHRCNAAKFKGKPGAGGSYVWTYHGSASCTSN
jgi:hypothetical protein